MATPLRKGVVSDEEPRQVTNDERAPDAIRLANFPLLLSALLPPGSSRAHGALLGTVLGSFVPRPWAWLGVGLIALIPLVSSIPTWMGWNQPRLFLGRRAARTKKDFVVFLIGIRPNFPWKLSPNLLDAGKAMEEIQKELKGKPEIGCLGSESFVGSHTHSSTLLLVQYWESADHLEKYAQSSSNSHYGPWKKLMILGKKSPELGFWHETFVVRNGDYEAIYVNCPLFGLANARGVSTEAAARGLSTMRGRLGKGVGQPAEWPEGFDQHANY
jgi:hypothetical protein